MRHIDTANTLKHRYHTVRLYSPGLRPGILPGTRPSIRPGIVPGTKLGEDYMVVSM